MECVGYSVYFYYIWFMEDNSFEWLEEIGAGFTLEPNTMYYFPDGDGTPEELLEKINPIHDTLRDFFERISKDGDTFFNYFVTDEDLCLDGWCNETDWREDNYRNIKKINIRKLFDNG